MRNLIYIAAIAVAACASGEEANLSSLEGNEAETAQALADDVTGASDTNNTASEPAVGGPSQWFQRTNQGNAWAGYGPPFSEAVFSVRCEGEQLIFSTTEMPRAGPGTTTLLLSAPGVEQTLPAEASEQGLPNTEAAVPADAGWLNGLASASGDLTVRVGDGGPILVPIADPLTSLIRDCRS